MRNYTIISLVIAGIITRLVPHWPNFTPVMACALFAGVYIKDKRLAVLVPLLTMFISDLFIGFYPDMLFVYVPIVLITFMGSFIRKVKFANILGASVLGFVIHFLSSNFGAWIYDPWNVYTNDFAGLMASYVAALPFASQQVIVSQLLPGPASFTANMLFSDLFYNAILFGGFALAQNFIPSLKPQLVKA